MKTTRTTSANLRVCFVTASICEGTEQRRSLACAGHMLRANNTALQAAEHAKLYRSRKFTNIEARVLSKGETLSLRVCSSQSISCSSYVHTNEAREAHESFHTISTYRPASNHEPCVSACSSSEGSGWAWSQTYSSRLGVVKLTFTVLE
jgi:hypothetical protein